MRKTAALLLCVVLLGGISLFALGVERGGTIVVSGRTLGVIDDPARYSWVANSNPMRMVAEYLTYTDENNDTVPWLLESWEASEDLLTWTLVCRQGILFSNGDEFNADDVVFNIKRWLDPEVGSSILGLMGAYLEPDGVVKIDEYTVQLNLKSPSISVPSDLYHYCAQIMNSRTFEGDFIEAPIGTGPFVLDEYSPGERVVLKSRNLVDGAPAYWRDGEDGQPLPYVDEVIYLDMGDEAAAHIAAFQSGSIDVITEARLEHFLALKDASNAQVIGTPTAQTRVMRMRVDQEPWDDNLVRTALKMCVDREKMLDVAYYGEGVVGADHHVSPVHPAYCEIDPIPFDPEGAKALLEAGGYTTPLSVEISVGTGWADIVSIAQILKEDAAPAFDVSIATMPVSTYWDLWTEVPFGITPWTHRPLGTMVLALAYICDADYNAVPWNESRWCDYEFTRLLVEAQGIADPDERRLLMCQLETIQRDRGSIVIPYWRNVWAIANTRIQNFKGHPTQYDEFLREAWIEE